MMRVSSGQIYDSVLQSIRRNDAESAKVMQQMSSGERITRWSDDALGTVRLVGLEKEEKSLDQWQNNLNQVKSRLDRAETNLDSSMNIVFRMQDLILNARTDSTTQKDREAIVSEIEVLKDTLISYSNATDGEGNYIFSGSRTDVPPVVDTGAGYAYQGDNVERKVPVGQGVEIDSNITIDTAFFNGGNFFDDIQAFIDDVNAGSPAIATTSGNALDGIGRTIDGIGRALSNVGARINSANDYQAAHQDMAINNQKIMGQIRDLDYVEAVSRAQKIENALITTQKTFVKVSESTLFNYL